MRAAVFQSQPTPIPWLPSSSKASSFWAFNPFPCLQLLVDGSKFSLMSRHEGGGVAQNTVFQGPIHPRHRLAHTHTHTYTHVGRRDVAGPGCRLTEGGMPSARGTRRGCPPAAQETPQQTNQSEPQFRRVRACVCVCVNAQFETKV